ncbi:MAG: hypothetical protein QOI91_1889 [Solirubrobacteraceae bacterium]|jgi:hypothetical protein|nr:hypothetical protein [Solirubrobacteraceae bacterium]MDX6671526.1 hypothetical protein [Solirubrobacteraceae bacterium]
MTESADLDVLVGDLEKAAAQLRSGELDPDGAAALVDECARLASRAAAELDRQARAAEPPPGQDSLL